MSNLCECGCGEEVIPGRRFRQGHYSRTTKAREGYESRRKSVEAPNPSGLCMCGCGETTPIYTKTVPVRGYRKGDHWNYMPGHWVPFGEGNPAWKGGRWKHKTGYIYVYAPEHPSANHDGYVLEHRLVLEKTLGRYLEPNEHGHHINGVKDDNRPENLVALTKNAHHALHGAEALQRYRREHPGIHSRAGKLGAEARWGKKEAK